ncbi:ABC transporter permease [Paenibacillus athensensis]|uniref:ABC transporter permease n=1 Tax=Paenibacillus athensensis TaxID=1967502 RepID=A0A4Y8PZF7_9BACL|nr:ABC transporter permease [Paenibacillus athensensis]MCD1258558.1 ABC transporter permease [Paenibacillus athensensis]
MKQQASTVLVPSAAFPWRGRIRKIGIQAGVLLAPFILYGLFLLIYGVNPVELYVSLVKSTFGDLYGFGEVLVKATPILLTGLAAALPARAGLVNVGGEGQLAIGALFTTWFAVFYLNGLPAWLGIPAMLVAGALGGAVWAAFTALLKVKGRINETISSLLLNYVATFTVGYFVHGMLKDPKSFNWPFSPELVSSLRLPVIDGTRLHIGFLAALGFSLLVWFVLTKTRIGYRVRVLGSNRFAAERAGFSIHRMYFWVLIGGGALAGVAGMIEIAGIEGRLRPTTGVNYGYLGFLAAWMAWNHPLRLMLTSFLLGMIAVAGNTLEIQSGLPSSSVQILMALVLFFLLGSARRVKR